MSTGFTSLSTDFTTLPWCWSLLQFENHSFYHWLSLVSFFPVPGNNFQANSSWKQMHFGGWIWPVIHFSWKMVVQDDQSVKKRARLSEDVSNVPKYLPSLYHLPAVWNHFRTYLSHLHLVLSKCPTYLTIVSLVFSSCATCCNILP